MNNAYVLYLALFKMLKTFWLVPLVLIVGLAVFVIEERRCWRMKNKEKFDVGSILPLEYAEKIYKEYGIAHIITDGRYVQIEKEPMPASK